MLGTDRTNQDLALPVFDQYQIAVLVPCFNEEATVGKVVADFCNELPTAAIYVFDNNSTDRTAELAASAGAFVIRETRQGKGNVIRRMFAEVEADIYVLVDGDDTYDASAARQFVERLLRDRLDFINGARQPVADAAYRRGHQFGNIVLSSLVQAIFGRQFRDMLSGYKVFSRRFVKSFPAMSRGFEIETELSIHALELRMPCAEIPTTYRERPVGSESKLRTFRDGWRILTLIIKLIKDERPLRFFGAAGAVLMLVAIGLVLPLVGEYLQTGLVPRIPTAVLCSALAITSILSVFTGLIMDMITKSRQEMKRLFYLSIPAQPPSQMAPLTMAVGARLDVASQSANMVG
jgi:glycosyltransferase involved in cell wall biosynthesis